MTVAEVVKNLRELEHMREELENEIDGLKDQLKAEMTEANGYTLRGADYKVTYHEVRQNKIDSTALKKDLPEIAEKYTKTTVYRRFLLS